MLCCFDGRHPNVLIVFHVCQTLSMHPQDMWNGWQHIHDRLYLASHPTPPWRWLGGLQILQNLGPHLWCSVAWRMEGISMYGLYHRPIKPFPFINKKYEKDGNPPMTTCTSHHIPHLPGDGLVVFKSGKILAHCFSGLLPGWRASVCMC